jgi:homoserine dehydrogenase
MIPEEHPLAAVSGVYNAVYVTGDAVGETMFFGEGAGSLPAASAVVGDLIEVARRLQVGNCKPLVGCTCTEKLPIRDISSLETRFYVRMKVADKPGVLAATAKVFGDNGVSLASVIQQSDAEAGIAELVYVTHLARESAVRTALEQIEGMDVVGEVASVIRVEDL